MRPPYTANLPERMYLWAFTVREDTVEKQHKVSHGAFHTFPALLVEIQCRFIYRES